MQNTNTTLHQAAQLLQRYGWQAGKVEPMTTASEKDWLESRERAYRLADYTDARAARLAAAAQHNNTGSSSTATRVRAKVKRVKVAPSEGGLFEG